MTSPYGDETTGRSEERIAEPCYCGNDTLAAHASSCTRPVDAKHGTRDSLLARIVSLEGERRKLNVLGGWLLNRVYDPGDPLIYQGHQLALTEDHDLCVWTEEAAANGGNAEEAFLGDDPMREAFCWLAKLVPDEVSE